MTNQEFEVLYKKLNSAQKEAVDTTEGAVMVVAGPGTGKTQVLTLRIANILKNSQINPENILALTFTEAGAQEMRKRLLSIIGHDAYRVEITTFHSFCNNLIKNNQEEFSHIISSVSINDIEQLKIIQNILISILDLKILRPLGDPDYYIKPILSAINDLKKENVSPDEFEESLNILKSNLDADDDKIHEKGAYKGKMKSEYIKAYKDYDKNYELMLCFKEYQNKLSENKSYDYSDMLLEVISKLKDHPYLLQSLQEKFQYFLVDEHQDTNSAQNKIIELLCGFFENPNLFVVGDEKQAIFRFQGASLENFLYFKELYPEAKLINLSDNYRSTQTILDATYAMIMNNPKSSNILSEGHGLKKKSLHKEEKIFVSELGSPDSEYFYIAEKIKLLLKNTNPEEIAILARNNRDIYPIADILEKFEIPYVVESDNNILNDIEIQKMILILRAIDDPISNNSEYIKKTMLIKCFRINPLDVLRIMKISSERKLNFWEIIQDDNFLNENKFQSVNEIIKFVNLFINSDTGFMTMSNNEKFSTLFAKVFNNSGILKDILGKPNSEEILNRFTRLYDEIKDQISRNPIYSLSDFLIYIDLLKDNDISLKSNSRMISKGYVRLMTVHKSKGLEFDSVFIINTFDGHWGNSRRKGSAFKIPWEELGRKADTQTEDDRNTDERRLFYVGLTRARKNIFISYSATSLDGREQIPSQFIAEIPDEYIVYENNQRFENDFLRHREKIFIEPEIKNDILYLKEYVSDLFRAQGMSVSSLNNYLECPWKFFFVNLIRLPDSISDDGLYGTAIHSVLNNFILNGKLRVQSEEDLINKFKEELIRFPISPKSLNSFLERGENALKGYYKNKMINWGNSLQSELNIKGIRISDDLIINGKIDMIMPKDKSRVDVYDFKTGRIKTLNEISGNTKNSNGNYKRQLVFYKILLDRYKDGLMKMENGIIEFVEPNENGEYKSVSLAIENSDAEELLKQLIDISIEIINFSFKDRSCGDKECIYCGYRSFMS